MTLHIATLLTPCNAIMHIAIKSLLVLGDPRFGEQCSLNTRFRLMEGSSDPMVWGAGALPKSMFLSSPPSKTGAPARHSVGLIREPHGLGSEFHGLGSESAQIRLPNTSLGFSLPQSTVWGAAHGLRCGTPWFGERSPMV
jgi:hypothetical protein